MARLKIFILLLLVPLLMNSCKWFDKTYKGYGVIMIKHASLKSDSTQSDSAEVINFTNGYSNKFELNDAVSLGSEVYSESMNAFGYESVDLGYHFVDFDGKEVLDVDLPYNLMEGRLDDNKDLLIGLINDPALNVSTVVAYDYKKGEEVLRYELNSLYSVSLCSSAYSPDSSIYYFFSDSALIAVNIENGNVKEYKVNYHPVLVVYDHKSDNLVLLVNIIGDSVLTNLTVMRVDPYTGEIISSAETDINVVAVCATGYDYDKDALVVYTLGYTDGKETGIIKFIDANSGETIEDYEVGDADRVVFWRD